MLRGITENECIGARKRVSQQLDGELSELGAARLRAHLRVCPACADFAATTRAATAALREAPLEQPARTVALPRPRHAIALRRPLSVAAAVLLFLAGVGGSFFLGSQMHGGRSTTTVVAAPVAGSDVNVAVEHMLAAASAFAPARSTTRPFAV